MTDKIKIGGLFERLFAKLFGGTPVPGSGNGAFRKLDTEQGSFILWSLKATSKESFSLTKKDMQEVYEAIRGLGGVGGSTIGGLVICFVEGEEPSATDEMFAVINIHDFVSLLKEKPEIFQSSKADNKYATAAIPQLFRQND